MSQQKFSSKMFEVPFDVTIPESVKAKATAETATLVSWDAVSGERFVRIEVPVVLYQPNSAKAQAPPKDYLTYLRGLTRAGGSFTDEKTLVADGHSVTLMTATTKTPLDGVLGCPRATPRVDCFGLQPDLSLRLAVIDAGGKTLLAWARVNNGAADAADFFGDFETMISSLVLR